MLCSNWRLPLVSWLAFGYVNPSFRDISPQLTRQIGYGTNYIGGTGDSQSNAAWLIPICIQILPAIILAAGMMLFMPQSPRHLMNTGRDEECLQTLARLRGTSTDDLLVRIEYLEIKSLYLFEKEVAAEKYPQWQDGSFKSRFQIGLHDYMSLVTNPSLFKRTTVAVCIPGHGWCGPANGE